jgi:hypothetical protein
MDAVEPSELARFGAQMVPVHSAAFPNRSQENDLHDMAFPVLYQRRALDYQGCAIGNRTPGWGNNSGLALWPVLYQGRMPYQMAGGSQLSTTGPQQANILKKMMNAWRSQSG